MQHARRLKLLLYTNERDLQNSNAVQIQKFNSLIDLYMFQQPIAAMKRFEPTVKTSATAVSLPTAKIPRRCAYTKSLVFLFTKVIGSLVWHCRYWGSLEREDADDGIQQLVLLPGNAASLHSRCADLFLKDPVKLLPKVLFDHQMQRMSKTCKAGCTTTSAFAISHASLQSSERSKAQCRLWGNIS